MGMMELLVIGAAALCLVVIGVVAVVLYVALKGRKKNAQG
jgi:hypothetical protein